MARGENQGKTTINKHDWDSSLNYLRRSLANRGAGECEGAIMSGEAANMNGVSSTEKPKRKLIKLPELCGDLKDLSYKWHSFGVHLRMEVAELSKIQADFGGNANKVDNCFVAVLDTWRLGDPEEFDKETLVDALRNISHNGLANDVQRDAPDHADFKKLSTQQLCEMLAECKPKYSLLGVQLGLSLDKVSEIEKMCGPGDSALCLQHMLQKYLREKNADLDELCKALVHVDMKGLCEKLREKYEGREFSH